MQKIRRRPANCSRSSGRQPETPCCRLGVIEQRTHRQAVSDSRAKCAPTGYVSNTDEWPQVTQRSVVESLVRQHGRLVPDALWNSQPVEADASVGDVVTETQAVAEAFNTD